VSILEKGSIFGFRTAKMYIMETTNNLNVVSAEIEPAKLSILAETSRVVTYFFHMRNFKYLPEEIKVPFDDQKTLLNHAKSATDYDDESIDVIRKQGLVWDEYKEHLYYKTAVSQFYQRRINHFKDY
jgi:hypothetical protein